MFQFLKYIVYIAGGVLILWLGLRWFNDSVLEDGNSREMYDYYASGSIAPSDQLTYIGEQDAVCYPPECTWRQDQRSIIVVAVTNGQLVVHCLTYKLTSTPHPGSVDFHSTAQTTLDTTGLGQPYVDDRQLGVAVLGKIGEALKLIPQCNTTNSWESADMNQERRKAAKAWRSRP